MSTSSVRVSITDVTPVLDSYFAALETESASYWPRYQALVEAQHAEWMALFDSRTNDKAERAEAPQSHFRLFPLPHFASAASELRKSATLSAHYQRMARMEGMQIRHRFDLLKFDIGEKYPAMSKHHAAAVQLRRLASLSTDGTIYLSGEDAMFLEKYRITPEATTSA